ncbi:MAG TPA: hypothetical protein VGC65_04710 [Bacteroidia bacterium]|jgi:hypothetical protein
MNKTKLVTASLLLFMLALSCSAQDTIYKITGAKIIVNVTEINSSAVKYKFYNAESTGELLKSEIAYIVYANGLKEMYNMSAAPLKKSVAITEIEPEKKPEKMHRNILAINCFDILFTNFSFSYERISKTGKYSLKIPLSFGLGGKPNMNNYESGYFNSYYLQNRIYGGGLEFNIYPFAQSRHTFYIGLSAVAGNFNYFITTPAVYDPATGYYYPQAPAEKHVGLHYAGMLHIGGYIGLSENLLLGGKLGLGYKHEETILTDYTTPKAQLDLNLAYRF